jgi:hypothetical protein
VLNVAQGWLRHQNLRGAEWNRINPRVQSSFAHDCRAGEPPTEDPATALETLKPENFDINDFLAYYVWLVRWLGYCLPGDRRAQRAVLEDMSPNVRP